MSEYFVFDLVRILVLVLFGLVVGQTLWIIRLYARRMGGRLLPRHILTVGVMFIFALTEVAYQTAIRVGDSPTWHLPFRLFVAGGSWYALHNMTKHLKRRMRAANPKE